VRPIEFDTLFYICSLFIVLGETTLLWLLDFGLFTWLLNFMPLESFGTDNNYLSSLPLALLLPFFSGNCFLSFD
jgi:hypothetical protein